MLEESVDSSTDTTDWTALSARASLASHRLIGWVYWDPTALANYAELGITDGAVTYVVSRGAPLAPAGHQAVSAAFYTISSAFIEISLHIAEQHTTYPQITAARNSAVAAGLRSYVPEICDQLGEYAGPLWAAADGLPQSGRVLFAAHRQQPRPDDQVLSAWLALNCIREWRGDTHFAILAGQDISGVQAGLLHNDFLNYPKNWIPRSRGADDSALQAALSELELRGLVDDGEVSALGSALRERIEARTNELTERAWRLLGADLTTSLLDLIEPVGPGLLARVDATAGPNWMPAARPRRP